jgi:hypothetical protein
MWRKAHEDPACPCNGCKDPYEFKLKKPVDWVFDPNKVSITQGGQTTVYIFDGKDWIQKLT